MIVGLSLCVYPMLLGKGMLQAGMLGSVTAGQLTIWALAAAVAVELLMGYVVGFCASLPLIGMQLSGQIIDQQMGVSAGGVFNPELDSEAGVIGQVLFMSGLAMFLIVGGHHAIMLTLISSFEVVPIGQFASPGSTVEIGQRWTWSSVCSTSSSRWRCGSRPRCCASYSCCGSRWASSDAPCRR